MREVSAPGGLVLIALLGCGCGASGDRPAAEVRGEGDSGETTDQPLACAALVGVVRDFSEQHPDFEGVREDELGLVQPFLGPDQKPVYAPGGASATVSGADSFAEWYRDASEVNQSFPLELPLEQREDGLYAHEDDAFFPLDERGFGNEGRVHNFHFTSELHARFRYRGGELVRFHGDDDLWLFVNGRLALDLGGVHEAAAGEVALDEHAEAWQLRVGGVYALAIFHAERHTEQSVFRLETNIDCFEPVTLE